MGNEANSTRVQIFATDISEPAVVKARSALYERRGRRLIAPGFQAFNKTVKGVPKWWDVIVLQMQRVDEDKNLKQIIAVSRDITVQKEAAKKIEDSNERYHTMLMQSPFAFSIMKGNDTVITLANTLMKQFGGREKE